MNLKLISILKVIYNISYIIALPEYNMNKWTIFVYFLAFFIVKMAESGSYKERGNFWATGRFLINIYY